MTRMALAPQLQPKMPATGPWKAKNPPLNMTVQHCIGVPATGEVLLDTRDTPPPWGAIVDIGSLVNGVESLAVVVARSNDGRRFSFTTLATVDENVLLPD